MDASAYISQLTDTITKLLRSEWEAQGHSMTGKLIDDMDLIVKQEVSRMTISGMIYAYGSILNTGVTQDKIPYSGRSGRGGISLYIQGLQNYAKAKMGADDKKSLGIAFAIASTQKKHGMPTYGSYKYSTTGKRMRWIDEALQKDDLTKAVRQFAYQYLNLSIDTFVTKWQTQLR